MALFHEDGDHSLESPGGNEEEELVLDTRGADATLSAVVVADRGVVSDDGVKATPPPMEARRMAALLDLIVIFYYAIVDDGKAMY